MSTPREDGLRMPAEWAPHQATLMEWPTRKELWRGLIDEAKRDFATMANAVAAFEPVVMVADPSQESEARAMCGEGVEILPIPIDDSWMRDNGPIFVTDGNGGVALVQFRFNGWGNAYSPYDRDCPDPGTDRVASRACGATRRRWSWRAARSSWTARGRSSRPSSASCTRTAIPT